MLLPTYADAVKKNLKKDISRCPSINSMFKPVVSMKNAPDCTKAGCRMKAKYGFSAPPTYCKTDKLEGMHEITIEEMNSLSKPVQSSSDAVIVNVPSTILDSNEAPVPAAPTIQKVNETAGKNEFQNCGRKLNPH